MSDTISTLLDVIARTFRALVEFLTILVLGLVAAVLIVIPWLLRTLALVSWIAGTYLLWTSVQYLYAAFTPTIPLIALTAIPATLSVALPVWLFSKKRQGILWGALTLWGVIGLAVKFYAVPQLSAWLYGDLVIRILPSALSATLLFYVTMRFGPAIRMKRLSNPEGLNITTKEIDCHGDNSSLTDQRIPNGGEAG